MRSYLSRGLVIAAGLCVSLAASSGSTAELSSRERRIVDTVERTIRSAGENFQAGQYQPAGEDIRRAIKQIEVASAAGSAELFDTLQPAIKRVMTAHTMLSLEGVSLPPFEAPTRPSASAPVMAPERAKPASPSEVNSSDSGDDVIRFTPDVTPILMQRCGQCHVSSSRGQFSMASFNALMKGPPEGVVVFAGDVVGSRLIETIKSGSMPKGGGRVSPDELKVLEAWVLAGAKFDGPDPAAPLASLSADSATTTAPQPPPLAVNLASGTETVSFAGDVAALLVQHCSGCHINAMQTQGGLRMDTFTQLLRGGDHGRIIVPRQSGASLLVKKLQGTADGQRMPAGGRPALSAEAIATIVTWIDEGATLDGANAQQPLAVMSQLAWVAKASDAEMSEKRYELAQESLKLVMADAAPLVHTTEHFLVIGNSSQAGLQRVAKAAEELMKTARSLVGSSAGESFFHGRATIFVMPRRYDYSEFAKMVEGRAVPSDWAAHWRFDGVGAYLALVAADDDSDQSIRDRLLAPLVSLAVATRGGDVPRWFAHGAGAAIASRSIRVTDPLARDRRQAETRQALAATENAKQFLDAQLTPEQTDLVAAAIMSTMLDPSQRKYFDQVMRQLVEGNSFHQAFEQTFRVPVATYVDAWLKRIRSSRS